MILRSAVRRQQSPVVAPAVVVKKAPKVARKVAKKDDVVSLSRSLSRKEEGVYMLNDTYYAIYDGNITYFNSPQEPKNLTVAFLKRLKMCPNSDVLLEWHTDGGKEDSYVHVVSNRYDVDGYAQVCSADQDALEVELFTETISERENGTRTWDTEYVEPYTIEWKYVDSIQTVYDLPAWTDSEPDSSSESEYDSEDEDSE